MPAKPGDIRRRALLATGLSTVAGAAMSCGRTTVTGAWRFFTDEEARTVEAICAQLIPADGFPGAKEAGAANYIDLQLSKRFRKYQTAYREGLAGVDAASRKAYGKRFTDAAEAEQIEVLNTIEEEAKPFFNLILAHTRQGFYGDPRHGGNRNRASWKMLGLPEPPIRGRQQDVRTKAV